MLVIESDLIYSDAEVVPYESGGLVCRISSLAVHNAIGMILSMITVMKRSCRLRGANKLSDTVVSGTKAATHMHARGVLIG